MSAVFAAPGTPALDWRAAALQDSLAALWPGLQVEVQAHCTSTNTVLLERARLLGDALRPTLLVAETQTHGRGRMGRTWHARAGASLTFSLALELDCAAWSGLSLAVGLALADALDPLHPGSHPGPQHAPVVGLKWPNDVWLWQAPDSARPDTGRKLAGILIETRQAGARRVAVIGVGLNVLAQSQHGLGAGSACWQDVLDLQAAGDQQASAPAALALVAAPLLRALVVFQTQGFAPLQPAFAARDVLRGQAVVTTSTSAASGVADGVDSQGALCVRTGGGLLRLVSGEVSVRLTAEAAATTASG